MAAGDHNTTIGQMAKLLRQVGVSACLVSNSGSKSQSFFHRPIKMAKSVSAWSELEEKVVGNNAVVVAVHRTDVHACGKSISTQVN